MRVPGMDGAPEEEPEKEKVVIGEHFSRSEGAPADIEGKWPGFRGRGRANIVGSSPALLDRWPGDGLEPEWSVELGEGHAGPAVWRGRVYVLDYDERRRGDALRCFSLNDGKEIWRRWYEVPVKRNHGMSRTVPSVSGGKVVTMGPKCHVMCVDAVNGDLEWSIDLQDRYGSEVPFWYTAQCPLIDGETVVLAPAGKVLMTGVDLETGRIKWETPNTGEWEMSHASIMPMQLEGREMYVYPAIGGVVGVSAEEEDAGEILWQSEAWDHSVVAPSPVALDDGRIFLTAGYGAGAMMLKVSAAGEEYITEVLDEYGPARGLASEQHTPIFYRGHLFGVLPRDGGALKQQFVCYNSKNCREPVWKSGKTDRFGLGPYILADGKFYVLDDTGRMTIVDAATDEYRKLDSARLFEGRNAWGPIAVAGTRMLVRDSTRMFCFDIRQR